MTLSNTHTPLFKGATIKINNKFIEQIQQYDGFKLVKRGSGSGGAA
jgi:hypothetical protein